jgi:glycosyltransferase involved in cell wall biosynthesis
VKLSVIVATKDRADALGPCLQSIDFALRNAQCVDAEIVVVDNGSKDNTADVICYWMGQSKFPLVSFVEPTPGKARALNLALRGASGDLLAFTDDDCRLDPDYVTDLLRYDAADMDLVLRSGRIELGDTADLAITINTSPDHMRWSLASKSARYANVAQNIAGCNMVMRRALFERVGFFDVDFGPGAQFGSTDDTDYVFRAYLCGAILEHVPDMAVFHYHGRKARAAGAAVMRGYMIGSGAMYIKYLFEYPHFCRQFGWDLKSSLNDMVHRTNTFLPDMGFSHWDKVALSIRGGARYLVARKIPEWLGLQSAAEGRGRNTVRAA